MKVAVSQRFLPHYRVGFFEQLRAVLDKDGGELRLLYSFELGSIAGRPTWAEQLRALRKDLQVGELEESAVFAPGLLFRLIRYAPDVVVLEDLSGLPNSLVGALYCRLWRKPYLVWGLGEVPAKARSPLRRLLAPAIRFLYEGASGFVCYSEHAAQVYGSYGKPTYVAPNAYQAPPSPAALVRAEVAVGERYGRTPVRILSIGALKRQKRVDVLIRALALLGADVEAHIIGDGPEAGALQQLARELGVESCVVFHGAVYDDAAKAAVALSCHLGVVPGRGGLAIQEMMAYGLPVISGVADGTERDLIRPGESGYLIDGFPTADQTASAVRSFIALPAAEQARMARAALGVVLNDSNTAVMAEGFARAVAGAARP